MKLRKLFAAGLALVMTLAMAAPAFATNVDSELNGKGSITIENATVDETYSIYKVFDATYSGDNVSYTINSQTSRWYTAINNQKALFTLTQSASDENVYVVSRNDGVTDTQITDFFQAEVEAGNIPAEKSYKAEESTVKFTNVPYGYYVIETTLGEAVVTVTTAKPDAVVIDKNQAPGSGFEKTVGDTTVQIGETAAFTIKFTATNYDGEKKITEYIVNDNMGDALTLLDNFVVTVGGTTLSADKYTIVKDTTDKDDFTITIPWTNASGTSLYASPVEVVITYKAKLTSEAGIAGDAEKNVNEADLKWTKEDNTKGGSETAKTETLKTYALAIKKVNKAGQPLESARFTLKNGTEDVKVSLVSTSDDKNVYVIDPAGTATVVTPKNGLVIIKGVDSDAYTLTETVAPSGYNLLTSTLTVTPQELTSKTTTTTIYLDKDGNVVDTKVDEGAEIIVKDEALAATVAAVVNFTGIELPSTGGMGTTLFYIVGGLMVVCAGVVLVTKKRMGNK